MSPAPRPSLDLLSNGVRVAVTEMPHMQSAAIGFWTGTGSRNETAECNGVAHFIEHLLFKGTETRSAEELSRQIERLGGAIDAFTSEDQAAYQVKGPADQLAPLLEVTADLFQHPRFDPGDLESERGVIHEEIAMIRDQPSQWLEDLTSEAAWPGHPLGRPITGTTESLDSIDRETVLAFYRSAYCASQAVVTVAGRVERAEVLDLLEGLVGGLAGAAALETPPAPPPASGLVFGRKDDLEQAHLAVGFHSGGRMDEARHALKLLNVMLGENMSSRLFQELREKAGLCYEIQSDLMAFAETGLIHAWLALEPRQVPHALALLRSVLDDFARRPVPRQELEEAKAYVIGQSRIALENTSAQMSWTGECLLARGELVDPEEIYARLGKVTPEEVQELAASLFRGDRLVTAAVGPAAARGALEDWQGSFGPA